MGLTALLENDIGDVFFASVIDKVSLDRNLFIPFQKNLSSEFPNRVELSVSVATCFGNQDL
jgi:hypothetical protein